MDSGYAFMDTALKELECKKLREGLIVSMEAQQ